MINSYNRLIAKIAISFIQASVISLNQKLLHSTLVTPSERRHFYFCVKIKILGLDGEALFTILTNFCFLWHKTFYRKVLQDMNDRSHNATVVKNSSLSLFFSRAFL